MALLAANSRAPSLAGGEVLATRGPAGGATAIWFSLDLMLLAMGVAEPLEDSEAVVDVACDVVAATLLVVEEGSTGKGLGEATPLVRLNSLAWRFRANLAPSVTALVADMTASWGMKVLGRDDDGVPASSARRARRWRLA